MASLPKFKLGDLNLRDCWKMIRLISIYAFGLAFFVGILMLVKFSYEESTNAVLGTRKPLTDLWWMAPGWGKVGFISLVAFILMRGMVSFLLMRIGRGVRDLGKWLGKAPFKSRVLVVAACVFIAFIFEFFALWALLPLGLALCILMAFSDVKRDKVENWER